MNINSLLTNTNRIFPKIVNFLFNSKWTMAIIIVLVILYFIYIGMKKAPKVEEQK